MGLFIFCLSVVLVAFAQKHEFRFIPINEVDLEEQQFVGKLGSHFFLMNKENAGFLLQCLKLTLFVDFSGVEVLEKENGRHNIGKFMVQQCSRNRFFVIFYLQTGVYTLSISKLMVLQVKKKHYPKSTH